MQGSIILSACSYDCIEHPLKFSTVSARTLEASRLSNEHFASFFCTFIVTRDWNEVSHVVLFMLRSISYYSSSMMRRTDFLSFLLYNIGRENHDICLDGQASP